jgi:hypothetical protein
VPRRLEKYHRYLKALFLIGWSLYFAGGGLSAMAQTTEVELIRNISPNRTFAVRILCSSQPEKPENLDAGLIEKVELISLPAKTVIMDLPQDYANNVPKLIWAQDSTWLAFALASGPEATDTYIYYHSMANFTQFKADNLKVQVEGDVRNEYVEPIFWVKPGVLMLEQHDIFQGDGRDVTYRFAAAFDKLAGTVRIISKKKTH